MRASSDRIERDALDLLEQMLDRPQDERREWLRAQHVDDPRVSGRAEQLLESLEQASGRLATGGAPGDAASLSPPGRVGAYKIVDLLGQGGMGAVFRARRDTGDFEHEVAIKLIRPGALSDALVERFERERQILARLAHPNIARLYDGGTTEDGGPFIVMEFIEGTPITEWADENGLDLDARLQLFRRVCDAVGYAHRNLVIHRDLTPDNVLVTAAGEPKLIDFGIARPQEEKAVQGEADTSVSGLSLTPGFAAPERYSGAPATTLTDVYSLGKLLRELARPGDGDQDLDAIIARATAVDPEARYSGAEALADDVERLRTGRPVEAREGGRAYVVRRFVRRNRIPVAATVAALLLLVAALAGTTYAYSQAETARKAEAARFEEVRSLANTLLFDVYDSVDRVPGSTIARRTLAATAQGYLDALARDPEAPFEVRLEAAQGYVRLADVIGGVGGGTLGLRDQAMRNYERADQILTDLHVEHPGSEPVALALADLRYARANMMVHIADDMERGLRFARTIPAIVASGCTGGGQCALRLAQAHIAEGQSLHWLERFGEAVAAYDRALEQIGVIPPDLRRSERVLRLEAQARRFKGDTLYYLDDVAGSVRELGGAARLLRQGMAGGFSNPDIKRDLALVEWSRGGSLDEHGRPEEGAAALDDAYRIMEELVQADREDLGSLRLLAVIGGQRALTLSSAERYAEAIQGAEDSLSIRRRLSRSQPGESGYFRDVAIQLQALGDIYARAGRPRRACRHYRETVEQFDALDRRWGMTDFDRGDTYARAQAALAGC